MARQKISGAFFVGLFVVVGIVLTIAAIMWLGASKFFAERQLYVTYFEGSIGGLDIGSAVKYLGYPVGAVQNISVAPDGRLIEVVIQIEKKLDINDSLRVKAELAGIAGGKYLQLYYPTDKSLDTMFPKLSFTPKLILIKSTPSGLDEMEVAARDVMNNLLKLDVKNISEGTVSFLQASTKFFNRKELVQILKGIDETINKMNNILDKAQNSNIIDNVSYTSAELLKTAVNMRHFSEVLDKQVDSLNLNNKLNSVITVYDTTMLNTNKVINALGYRMETTLYSLDALLEDIKSASRQLKKSLQTISDNPSQMLFSNPPPIEK
jgi:ABC-type transporter Mla subunit MlaD